MGTRIEAACAQAAHGPRKPTARRLADDAMRRCLALAGREPGEVDLLINTGVYREDNMGEPALAALIQEDIGANLGQPPVGGHGTFSFDLANGTCGVISAIGVESGLLSSGVIRLGAIVASDVYPRGTDGAAAPIRPAGGAMLLRWDDSATGFTDFHSETFPEYQDLFASGLVWQGRRGLRAGLRGPSRTSSRARRRAPVRAPAGAAGQSRMVIDARPGYRDRLADCAEEATRHFLHRLGMGIGDIDLLVPAPAWPEFLDPLWMRLGIPGDRVAYTSEDLDGAHAAGPIAALQAAIKTGRLGESRNTLMVTAGAGITVSLALYRQTLPG
jgi:3-oxoacyl-[acyl-carrier-protein] synthase-3